jgi:hypothetical protein
MGTVAQISDAGLTPQEEQFAVAVIAHGGRRKKAYLEIYGPGIKNVTSAASKIAKKPLVAARIKQLLDDDLEIAKTNAKRVIAETARIAFANPLDIFDKEIYREEKRLVLLNLEDIPPSLSAAIKKIKSHAKGIEVEFHDKTRVLQDMQRRFGLLGERRDSESQQVHIHLDMRGDGPIDIKSDVIDVTPESPGDVY